MIERAQILAVGSELTTGNIRDANGGDLARELTELGVEVLRISLLRDNLELVVAAVRDALATSDLIICTGGLGPTPDDLTREAIAAATELEVHVEPELERWLRSLFRRRGLAMPEANLKQAWLVPGAQALHNHNGTAPGWWLEIGARVIVALPGPPREMWPMWREQVRPRLAERGAGGEAARETLRLTGIGESALVAQIGEEVLRERDPEVATYARPDAVDVRVSSRGPGATRRVEAAIDALLARLEPYVFARGEESWPEVIGRLLAGRSLAVLESGTAGQVEALYGAEPWFAAGELLPLAMAGNDVGAAAERIRVWAGADVGLAVIALEDNSDTRVEIGIADQDVVHTEERRALLAGAEGRRRAALAATMALWQWLKDRPAS